MAALPQLVEGICQHLKQENHRGLLRQLKNWTLDDKKTIYAGDISEYLYSSKEQLGAARIEVVRLRNALAAFYAREGATDPVQIGVEKTHYKLYDVTPKKAPVWRAPAHEVARVVQAFCELEGVDAAARTEKFKKWMKEEQRVLSLLTAAGMAFKGDFDEFLREGRFRLTVADLDAIGELFGISSLLLDPLLSEEHSGDSLTLDFNRDFSPIPRSKNRGKNATYSTAHRRLGGTDAAFVRLELDAWGESDNHEHLGDEMIWVESGEIEIHFELSGVSMTMKKHDLIHFYAEHRHRVVAKKRSTKCFIIRFYQLGSERTRQFLWRAVEGLLAASGDSKYEALRHEARAWMQEMSPSYRKKEELELERIQDVLGLARFLMRCRSVHHESGSARLDNETKQKLESARLAPTDRISFKEVAEAYGVEEFLLHSYCARAVPGMIVLRDAPSDFRQIAGLFAGEEANVDFYLPIRNLSCADMSLAKVVLKAGSTTGRNHHPGYEAILMVSGEVSVFFEGDTPENVISSEDGRLCHFNSARTHRIVNTGSEPAEFLVIRFHREGD